MAEHNRPNCDNTPVCSVCIANFNGITVIERCLDSVLHQDFDLPIEIIVHDDASSDASADLISTRYPQVNLIRSEKNVGYCISNNRMAAEAKGTFILLLNNDAVLHSDALKTLYSFATNQKKSAILGLPQYNMRTGELIDIGSTIDLFFNVVPNQNPSRHQVAMVIGACLWIPKALWNELGGFPEWFGSLAEDLYLCCLARLKGFPVIALSNSGFDHIVGKSFGGGKRTAKGMHTTLRRRALSERNRSYVMIMCLPPPLAYFIIPLHFIVLTLEGFIVSTLKGDFRLFRYVYLNCLKDVWSNRKFLLRTRIRLQVNRSEGAAPFAHIQAVPYKLAMLFKYGLPVVE